MSKTIFLGVTSCLPLLFSCESQEPKALDNPVKELTIVYTADEHGWFLPSETNGEGYAGATGLKEAWDQLDEANGDVCLLKLSGGDMWTGPAESSYFNGRSMVDIMNETGYHAAALGNHEFDFSVDTLKRRLEEMSFPLLAANVVEKATGQIPLFIEPFMVKEIDGIKVGIIGLASTSTPTTANPMIVNPYQFTDYEAAVRTTYNSLAAHKPDVTIILGHICPSEMEALVPLAKELNITAIGGGHCHAKIAKVEDGVALMESSSNMRNYIQLDLRIHTETDDVTILDLQAQDNNGDAIDEATSAIAKYWKDKTNAILGSTIGYARGIISGGSTGLRQAILNAWLWKYNEADIAITNAGGIRQDIPKGDINNATIQGLLPFPNNLYQISVTKENLEALNRNPVEYLLWGGVDMRTGTLSNGTQLQAGKSYTLLTTNYLYAVEEMDQFDDIPQKLLVNYRDPFLEWILQLNTSITNPLENHL